MTNNYSSNLIKFSLILTPLVLGITSLFSSPVQAIQTAPSGYSGVIHLAVNQDQCMAKALKAAQIVIGDITEPSTTNGSFFVFGRTSQTKTTLVCAQNGAGSIFMVNSNGAALQDRQNEAKSIRDRIYQFMQSE